MALEQPLAVFVVGGEGRHGLEGREAADDEDRDVGDVGLGVGVEPQPTLLLAATDVARHDRDPWLYVGLDQRQDLIGAIEQLAEDQAGAVAVFGEEGDGLGQHGVELLRAARGGQQELGQDVAPVGEELLEHGLAQGVLAAEVIEQRGLADADALGDLGQRDGVEAVGCEQAARVVEDLLRDVRSCCTGSRHWTTDRIGFAYHLVVCGSSGRWDRAGRRNIGWALGREAGGEGAKQATLAVGRGSGPGLGVGRGLGDGARAGRAAA
ncbi:hypothetical protein ENSA5_70290 [Enhygromyxa salina]|uniref:Uncharacterized protein n=1 Tax=Enhygromyxa salina TaxID=215803 RepID=A0A2S9XAJ6_9BACT|nr:hypothetical protein ENSA5_70290 [Enhygromyxa salina]